MHYVLHQLTLDGNLLLWKQFLVYQAAPANRGPTKLLFIVSSELIRLENTHQQSLAVISGLIRLENWHKELYEPGTRKVRLICEVCRRLIRQIL